MRVLYRSVLGAVAPIVFSLSLAASAHAQVTADSGQNTWSLGTSQNGETPISQRLDFSDQVEGAHILLPLSDGARVFEIQSVSRAVLGDVSLVGEWVDADGTFHLTQGGAGLSGRIEIGNEIILLRPAGDGRVDLISATSSHFADMREEERLVVAQGRAIARASEQGVVPVVSHITPDFERRYGLATRLRAQDLVFAINEALALDGEAVRLELIAVRDADTGTGSEPGISFETVDGISAEVIVSAVLPSSRTVQVNDTATAFATVINAGAETATACGLQLTGSDPSGAFTYQTTSAANVPTGTANTVIDIAPGAAQSFVFGFTPSAVFEPGGDLPLEFFCSNRASAPITPGVNTLWFSASANPVPDIVAISEVGAGSGLNTVAGVVDIIDRQRNGAFVVATTNVGVTGNITVSAAPTNGNLPLTVRVCQTNPTTGACLSPTAASVSLSIAANDTPTFAVFVIGSVPIGHDPANNRIQVEFRENGNLRGATTVAVRTLMSAPVLPTVSFLYSDADVILPAHFRNGPVAAADNTPIDNAITNPGATLGRVLFYDRRLSANNTISCASCHSQATGFSDTTTFSAGFEGGLTGRHSPGLSNARYYSRGNFFWDERADTLEDQVLMPIQDSVEMGLTLEEAVSKVAAEDFYGPLFTAAFGDSEVTSDRMSRAMAQFVRAMTSADSPFDQALADGPLGSQAFRANFSESEFLGLQLFMPVPGSDIQDVGCGACHNTLAHISDDIHNIGLDLVDTDEGAGNGEFKSPSLRNVGVRTHFMHDGRFTTLADVIDHYNTGVNDNPNVDQRLRNGPNPQILNLSDEESAALEAFLHTLTDNAFLTDPRFSDPFVD